MALRKSLQGFSAMESSEHFPLIPDCIQVPKVITRRSTLVWNLIDITGVGVIHVPPPMTPFYHSDYLLL